MVQTMKSKRLRKSIKPFSPMESRKVFTMKKKSDKIYTKQEQLYRNVTYQIRNMMFYMSYLNAYEQSKQKDKVVPTEELKNARLKVYNSKKKVRKLIEELNGLQNGHVMIEELKSPKEQDCIQLNRIYCSVCLKKRNKGKTNAILICHHLGCYRAYHQHCLEPKLKNEHLPKESDDWFCPTCHCKSLILNLVNQTLEREYHTVEEVGFLNILKGIHSINRYSRTMCSLKEVERTLNWMIRKMMMIMTHLRRVMIVSMIIRLRWKNWSTMKNLNWTILYVPINEVCGQALRRAS